MEHQILSELHNRFRNSLEFFDKEHKTFLEKQQAIIQTQTNWSHRLDQALRKRISYLIRFSSSSPSSPSMISLSNLLKIKHRLLIESKRQIHSISDYEQALEKFDLYIQQQEQ